MAVYLRDDAVLFGKAIASVLENTLQPDQFVVVADGPLSAELEHVLEQVRQQHPGRIDVLRLTTNGGLARALNCGLGRINRPWVVRADADDLNLPHRFERLAQLLACNPQVCLLGSAILEVDNLHQPIATRQVPESNDAIRRFARRRNPFNHMTVAYRKERVLAVGGYPEVYLKEDYALWSRMLASGVIAVNSPEILVWATAGRDMYARRGGWRYARSEFQMQEILVGSGFKGRLSGLLDGVARAAVFLAPAALRKFIYLKILRV